MHIFLFYAYSVRRDLHSFPTRRSSDLLDPLARLRLRRRGRYHRHDLVPILHVHQVQRHLRETEVHEVAVTFDQSWNRELTGDRKSTRLNSSHGYISYAVFCLKKKNQKL